MDTRLNDWEPRADTSPRTTAPWPDIVLDAAKLAPPRQGQDNARLANQRVPKELLAGMRSTRKLRERYARKAHQIAARCLSLWAVLLGVYGAIKVTLGVETWSDQVLIAITTGVTVSVLAAFLGVIRGLFPGKGKEDDKDDAKA